MVRGERGMSIHIYTICIDDYVLCWDGFCMMYVYVGFPDEIG